MFLLINLFYDKGEKLKVLRILVNSNIFQDEIS